MNIQWVPRSAHVAALGLGIAILAHGQSIDVRQSPVQGVDLVSPNAAEFPGILAKLVPQNDKREIIAPALPYSIIVRNSSSRLIHTIAIRFEFTRSDGTTWTSSMICPQPRSAFGLGDTELFTPSGALQTFQSPGGTDYNKALKEMPEVRKAARLTIYLDSIVYADGEMVGPDQLKTFDLYSAEMAGVDTLFAAIRGMKGQSDSSVLAFLKQTAAERPVRVTMTPAPLQRRSVARALQVALEMQGRQGMEQTLIQMVGRPAFPRVWKR